MSPQSQFILFFLLIGLFFSALLVRSLLNECVGLFERGLMVTILSRELLTELEPNFIDTDHGVENLGLLHLQHVVELLETLVRGKRFGLHLVLVSLLVEG